MLVTLLNEKFWIAVIVVCAGIFTYTKLEQKAKRASQSKTKLVMLVGHDLTYKMGVLEAMIRIAESAPSATPEMKAQAAKLNLRLETFKRRPRGMTNEQVMADLTELDDVESDLSNMLRKTKVRGMFSESMRLEEINAKLKKTLTQFKQSQAEYAEYQNSTIFSRFLPQTK